MSPSAPPHEPCGSCRSPVAADQRYCLRCGARRGETRVDPSLAWTPDAFAAASGGRSANASAAGTASGGAAAGGSAAGVASSGAAGGGAATGPGSRGPSRSLAAALVGGFLLVGGVLGAVLGSPADSSNAASAAPPPVIVVQAPPAVAAAPDAAAGTTTDDTTDDADASADDAVVPDDTASASAAVADDTLADDTVDTSTDTGDDTSSDADPTSTDTPTADGDDSGAPSATTTPTTTAAAFAPPAIKHVWIVTLTGQDYDALFGPASTATYLHNQLAPQGTVLKEYAPGAPSALAGGTALLSGQGTTDTTTTNCPTYVDATPTTFNGTTGFADATTGCVYPKTVPTLAGQITGASLTWKAYLQGQGDETPCRRPTLGLPDPWQQPVGDNGYITPRNPFVYFHAIVDDPTCATSVVDVDRLATDLADPATTPAVSWIVPDAFHSGAAGVAPDGTPTGPASADAFLALVVPQILASKAYTDDGLIAVVPDAPATADATTGALLVSPFVRKDKKVHGATGPYQLLRSIEDLFALSHLGHAGDTTVAAYDGAVYASAGSAASRSTHTIRSITTRSRPGGHIAPHPSVR